MKDKIFRSPSGGAPTILADNYELPPEQRHSYVPYYATSVMGEYLLRYHAEEFTKSATGHVIRVAPRLDERYNAPSTTS